jgi:hypothetical protein
MDQCFVAIFHLVKVPSLHKLPEDQLVSLEIKEHLGGFFSHLK